MTPSAKYFETHKSIMRYTTCQQCAKPFSDANVHSLDGWRETQISGYCEDCFDALFADDDE